ncbi:MAG: tetratricopeptide repeat protein, partial [Formivibrio sp.]|nr:tetratricopeptide repeat protein [Formivibrio sp.]
KYREAAIQFLNALKVDKNYSDAHYELAETYEHLGQLDAACTELARTVDLQPANSKARVDLGNLLFAGGHTNEAQAQANAVMAVQPNNPGVHALLSAIESRRGQIDQALIEIRRALELDPNRAAFHANFALLLSNDPTQSASVEDELKRAIALDPKSVNTKLLLAAFYARNNRLAQAEKISWDAVATDSKSVVARENVARIILQQGDRKRAEDVIRQAAKELADNPQGSSLLAEYYAGSGQLDKARAEFSNLAIRYPKNISVLKGYARVLIQVRDYAAARAVITGLMKSDSGDPEIAVLNGMVLLGNGYANEAVNALSEKARDFSQDASIQYWLGKAALTKGDDALAEQSFRRAANLNPSALGAQQELARIACLRGDMNLLADVAENTIAAAPQIPQGYDWRALVEVNHNLPEKAEADLKTALTIAPQNAQTYLQLGKLRLAQKRFSEAGNFLERALQYDPDSAEALRLLVDYDVYQKQPDKALVRLKAQIEKRPGNSSFYDLLAQQQMRNKDLSQAAVSTRKAIQLNPNDDLAVKLFAQIAIQRGQTADAVHTWEQWSNAHADDASALAILGTLEESRGDLTKAEAYYKKSLQIQAQQPIAANNLAYRMLQKGEMVDVALTLAQTARQGLPDSPTTADTLAWAYYCKGTYKFARDLLEDAVTANPNSATMQYHLGMVYGKLRDKNNATIHLKKAIFLAHDSPVGKDAKAALQGLV